MTLTQKHMLTHTFQNIITYIVSNDRLYWVIKKHNSFAFVEIELNSVFYVVTSFTVIVTVLSIVENNYI